MTRFMRLPSFFVLFVFSFGINQLCASIQLPRTPCDAQQIDFRIYGIDQHITTGMIREHGTKAFMYGPDNYSFVTADGPLLIFNIQVLFGQHPNARVKLLAFDRDCSPVFGLGPVFSNINADDENILTYHRQTHEAVFNGVSQMSQPSGIPRYLWLEVWNGRADEEKKASYSYLVDAQNLQNPVDGFHTTVFLVHGIAQRGGEDGDLRGLSASLRTWLDQDRFLVDAGFDYGYCANRPSPFVQCAEECSITDGGNNLATYIAAQHPDGDIILVGYSMGGLIARDMMLNHPELFEERGVAALITLGTPHLGYPWSPSVNWLGICDRLAEEMFGDFRNPAPAGSLNLCLRDGRLGTCGGDGTRIAAVSTYLYDLNTRWTSTSFLGQPGVWFAAAGTSCDRDVRIIPPNGRGCLPGTRNDGWICRQSASFDWNVVNGPCSDCRWEDPQHRYAHNSQQFSLFCPFRSHYPLSNPGTDPDLELIWKLRDWIEGLPFYQATTSRITSPATSVRRILRPLCG